MMLLNGDCLEQLKLLGDNSIDSIVTDPPYGIDHSYHGGGFNHLTERHFERVKIHDDDKSFDSSPWLALNVPTLFWGGNYFADKLPISSGWLVWDKERPDELD